MIRKECEKWTSWCAKEGTRRSSPTSGGGRRSVAGTRPFLGAACFWVGALLVFPAAAADGAMIRMWPAAVVTGEDIRVGDLCDLSAFRFDIPESWRSEVVAPAPTPGGSRIIHIDSLREAFRGAGANLAKIRIGGALTCVVTRPALPPESEPDHSTARSGRGASNHGAAASGAGNLIPEGESEDVGETLRDYVKRTIDESLSYYQGHAEVTFDRHSGFLDLTSPPYSFRIRDLGHQPVGLVSLGVDIKSDGREPRTVPVVAQVRLMREVLVARRAINQGSTIDPSDLARKKMSFTRLRDLGLQDEALAIGQRAKRFIQAGTMLDDSMLESVPLVQRGQLVNVVSSSGGIRIVTSGRVAADAKLGETVRVRASNERRIEYSGVVVGPGEVQVGQVPVTLLTLGTNTEDS